MALLHGFKQKFVDAAALSRNPETGRSATVADKIAAVRVVFDRLASGGPWNLPRGEGAATGGLLLRALCELYPARTPEALREYLAGKTAAERTALRQNARIAPIIDRLRGPVAAGASDEMLAELETPDASEAAQAKPKTKRRAAAAS